MADAKTPVKRITRKETKPYLVSTQLGEEAYQKLHAQATKEQRSISFLIRRAVLVNLGLDSKAA